MTRSLAVTAAALILSACATVVPTGTPKPAEFPGPSLVEKELRGLPAPQRTLSVAVYGFTDQTGQMKPSDTVQTFSRAVSQGTSAMLVKSLQEAGDHKWFTVVEREQLRNLLQERQIITEMRQRYLGEAGVNAQALPALLFAGLLLEGGVVGYDTNTVTGGAGAGFLGISANTQYRQDTVTVYLRAVSVKTGEVLTTVTASKTIASVQVAANVFRYVSFQHLLEAEAGYTTNEPAQVALQQAIDKAVYALILEGVDNHLWAFADNNAGWPFLWRYRQERDQVYTAEQMQRASRLAPAKPKSLANGGRPPNTAVLGAGKKSSSEDGIPAMAPAPG